MSAHTEQSHFPKGHRLGPYEIASSIGAGGMGEVFRARDMRLNRDVAVKVLPRDFVADADRLRRFEQEAKTLAALNHPNVLTVQQTRTSLLSCFLFEFRSALALTRSVQRDQSL